MKTHYYTDERNAQIVIALLKAYGIKRVIASPGTSTASIVASIQYDPWFKIWSAIDERHAAYMAVGMAAESQEPVVIVCTGATASRNYLPALSEAYYRKLPVLAITASQDRDNAGNMYSQFIDRSVAPVDTVKCSVYCNEVTNDAEFKKCELKVNKAIQTLTRHGGGPAHINLQFSGYQNYSTKLLPAVRKITTFTMKDDSWPIIPAETKIAVFVGNFWKMDVRTQNAIASFAKSRNAVVLCDQTSHYYGDCKVVPSLVCAQLIGRNPSYQHLKPDLIIHIGELANDYGTYYYYLPGLAKSWRVNPDGEIKDRFGDLRAVFECEEYEFFERMTLATPIGGSYCHDWLIADCEMRSKIPELPFSNFWAAGQVMPHLTENDVLHFGMSTSFQCWGAMMQNSPALVDANVGCCGIDGCMSSFIGASLVYPERTHFLVIGDLAFFYDLNSLGNRHIGKNIRILLSNNGCGGLFHRKNFFFEQFSDKLDDYQAAGGHFGSMSRDLVKGYVTSLGFEYFCASSKEEFQEVLPKFICRSSDKPIILECFFDIDAETSAWVARTGIDPYTPPKTLKQEIKGMVPAGVKNFIKGVIK